MTQLRSVSIFVMLLILWHGVVVVCGVPEYVAPSPLVVIQTLIEYQGDFLMHTYVSLIEIGMGLGFGLVLACGSALLFDQAPKLEKIMMPYMIVFKNLPLFVLAPLFMIWFGHGWIFKGVLISLSCYFPMTLGLCDGLRHSRAYTSAMLYNMTQTHTPKPLLILIWVRLPLALPSFFTSARLAFIHAPMSVIACDWMGASSGLGYVMMLAYGQLNLPMLFSGLVILLLISFVLYRSVRDIEVLIQNKLRIT